MFFSKGKKKKKKKREFHKTVLMMDSGKKAARREIEILARQEGEDFVPKLAQARVDLYSQAAYEGNDNAQYLLGMSYKQLEDKEAALEWLTMQARKGDVRSMKAIAQGYQEGGLFGENRIEYLCWLRKAAQAGDVWAQINLGRDCESKSSEKAREWYRKAARQGASEGFLELGRSWYREAMRRIGLLSEEQKEKIMDRVEECYIEAANLAADNHELAAASRELGNFYITSFQGELSPQRAAWFYCQAWRCEKKPHDLEQFQKICRKHRIKMSPDRMEEWEEALFGED